jgi:hypothetical protein
MDDLRDEFMITKREASVNWRPSLTRPMMSAIVHLQDPNFRFRTLTKSFIQNSHEYP